MHFILLVSLKKSKQTHFVSHCSSFNRRNDSKFYNSMLQVNMITKFIKCILILWITALNSNINIITMFYTQMSKQSGRIEVASRASEIALICFISWYNHWRWVRKTWEGSWVNKQRTTPCLSIICFFILWWILSSWSVEHSNEQAQISKAFCLCLAWMWAYNDKIVLNVFAHLRQLFYLSLEKVLSSGYPCTEKASPRYPIWVLRKISVIILM